MKRAGILAVSCALAMSTGAFAQAPGEPPAGSSGRPGTADPGQRTPPPPGTPDRGFPTAEQMEQARQGDTQEFFKKAAIANMAEVQLGQLASTKAESPDVKQFAQMMVDQHTKALEELRQAATSSNVALPTELDKKHQKLHDKLSKLSGREFDREYMDAMVDGHKDVRKLLEKQSKRESEQASAPIGTSGTSGTPGATGTSGTATGSAADASSWAAKTLPVVEGHLQQAEQIKDSLKQEKSNENAAPETSSPPETTPDSGSSTPPDSGSSTPPSTPPE